MEACSSTGNLLNISAVSVNESGIFYYCTSVSFLPTSIFRPALAPLCLENSALLIEDAGCGAHVKPTKSLRHTMTSSADTRHPVLFSIYYTAAYPNTDLK